MEKKLTCRQPSRPRPHLGLRITVSYTGLECLQIDQDRHGHGLKRTKIPPRYIYICHTDQSTRKDHPDGMQVCIDRYVDI